MFDQNEVELIAEILFRNAKWKKSRKIQELVIKSNHSGGGKPIPLSSCVNSKGQPCSPILREFLTKLDHQIYIDFFTKTDGKQLLERLPEHTKNKILVFCL